MHAKGHYGVSLLVFAPLGFVLLGAGEASLAAATAAAMLSMATLPDADIRLPGVTHRGVTHTLPFAVAVGGAFAGVAFLVADALALPPGAAAGYAFFVGTVSVLAHLLGDVLTPMGVAFLWPLSGRRFSVRLTRADSVAWNYALFALGVFVTAGVVVAAVRLRVA